MSGSSGGSCSAGCERWPDERVQLVLPCQAGPWGRALRDALQELAEPPGLPAGGLRHGRRRRSMRPGSCSSTMTRGWRSSRASMARGTRTWRISSRRGRRLQLFDAIFRHAEGYDGLPDLAAVKAFILGAEETAAAYARNYGGTVKEIRKAQRVNEAFQQVLDDPAAGGGAAASCAEAAARRGRGLAESGRASALSDHISGPRALADPIADITDVYAFPSPERPGHLVLVHEHAAVRASRPTGSRTGSSTASGCVRSAARRGRLAVAVRRRRRGVRVRLCVLRPGRRRRRRGQEGACTTPERRHGRRSVWTTSRAVERTGCGSLRGRAGIRSSWTPRRR